MERTENSVKQRIIKMFNEDILGNINSNQQGKYNVSSARSTSYLKRSDEKVDQRAFYQMDIFDILIYIFAPVFLIIGFFNPMYGVAVFFAVAQLCSLFTRSTATRSITLIATSTYLLLVYFTGTFIELDGIINLLFGISSLSLVPPIIGTLLIVVVMGSGLIQGLYGSTKFSGCWVIVSALIIASADTLVGILGWKLTLDWYVLFLLRFGAYLSAFLISWAVFYGTARLIRAGVLLALKKPNTEGNE